MLTEVDTRDTATGEVSLWMDTDAQVYLVAVEGHEPIVCLSRDYALQVWHHPYAYMPPEAHRSDPNGTEGVSLTEQASEAMGEFRSALSEMDDPEFAWVYYRMVDLLNELHRERSCNRPYDHGKDDPDIPFSA